MCVDVAWETSLWFGERHGEDLIRLISRKVSLWRMTFYISNFTTTLCFLFTDFSMMSFFSVFLGTLHCKSRFWRKDIYMTRFLCHSSLMQHKDIKPRIRVKAKQKTLHFRGGGLNYYYTQQLASQELSECHKRLHLSVAVNDSSWIPRHVYWTLLWKKPGEGA